MNFLNFCLIILQVTVNSVAQVLLKKGVAFLNFEQPFFGLFVSVITNWYILGGATIFVLSLVLWLYLLSQFELSFLYPISSLAFVITAVGGWIFLSENLSLNRGVGIVLIIMGVIFIAKS